MIQPPTPDPLRSLIIDDGNGSPRAIHSEHRVIRQARRAPGSQHRREAVLASDDGGVGQRTS